MRKLSKAQEMVLRQVADGKVKLVYVGDNEHSTRVWNAIGKKGRNINQTYDVLRKLDLVCSPYVVALDNTRKVLLTNTGENVVNAMGPAGTLIIQGFAPGTSDSWMIRIEKGEDQPYVLYFNGRVYDRYRRQENVYTVYRTHCPYVYDMEAAMSR